MRGLFDRTAQDYDRLEAILGLGMGSRYRRRALRDAGLKPGMVVLDIGTGTGLLACAAAAIVGDPAHVTGVDPSGAMLDHARVPAGLHLMVGSAEAIPAANASADFVCMGYALRHIDDRRGLLPSSTGSYDRAANYVCWRLLRPRAARRARS